MVEKCQTEWDSAEQSPPADNHQAPSGHRPGARCRRCPEPLPWPKAKRVLLFYNLDTIWTRLLRKAGRKEGGEVQRKFKRIRPDVASQVLTGRNTTVFSVFIFSLVITLFLITK